jgi:O-antigen/teichoic acid export membrane protein
MSTTSNRVIKNTIFLYAKMGITMFISLYTTRLILNILGVSDFGVFNIVGGAIAMLGFLNAAMASATQRFMSFAEGEGDNEKQTKIFNISFLLHFGIAVFMGFVLLVAGYFFFNGVLNIATDRIYAAKVVYGSLIISTIFTVMTVPYDAVLNAHENMLYYSIVGVVESLLKLGATLVLLNMIGDKLVLYGILMAMIPLITMTIMRVYCHKHYTECVFAPRKYWDRQLMKELTEFAGWNLMGATSSMISQYGLSIVLNNFFGTILNAAQGIANQISGQLMVFSNTMMKAVNPVIAKSEGGGNRRLMLTTSLLGSKFSYLLLLFFSMPFLIETPYILRVWLKSVPEWAVLFSRLQLGRSLVEQCTIMIGVAISAQGDIKTYSLLKSVLNILPIILTFLFFSFGFPPYYLYFIWIIFGGVFGGGLSIYFAKKKCGLKYSEFFFEVFVPCASVSLLMFTIGSIPCFFIQSSLIRFITVCLATSITFILSLSCVFLSLEARTSINKLIIQIKIKLKFIINKIFNKFWFKIVLILRHTSIYKFIYKSFWHSLFFNKKYKLNDNSQFFTARPNPGAGIGHQLANWIAGYWWAKQFGIRFANMSFSNAEWDELLGFGYQEPQVIDLLEQGYKLVRLPLFREESETEINIIRKIISSYQGKKVIFRCEQDQFYKDQFGVINEIQQKFYHAPSRKNDVMIYAHESFNIAVHVRRGDISDALVSGNENLKMRWQNTDYFMNVLANALSNLHTDKKIDIYIFSQGNIQDFQEFDRFENVHYCLEMDAMESFLHMVNADMLITSKSSFSYKPALLNKGIKICPKDFWHGYPISNDWVLADEYGNFEMNH